MIAWLNPAGFALLAFAAAPLIIHLLLRRRAVRVPFPTVRFLVASEQSAVRVRRPSDVLLLLVRTAIVACAALAIARPLFLSDGRRDAWSRRTTRAIVVDTSASVNAARAAEAVAAETRGAAVSKPFEAPLLRDALMRAAAWLGGAEPGLREIVVVSDFQRGSVHGSDIAEVPASIGLRMMRIESTTQAGASVEAPAVLHDGAVFRRTVSLEEDSSRVTLSQAEGMRGLEIQAAPENIERITRAIAAAGAIAPSPSQPLIVGFEGIPSKVPVARSESSWPREAAWRAFMMPELTGRPVRFELGGDALVLDISGQADSLVAAEITRAALNARLDLAALGEHEPAQIPGAVLASWTRSPSPPDAEAWRRTTDSDGRWLWAAVLGLLGVETWLRRERAARAAVVEARAA